MLHAKHRDANVRITSFAQLGAQSLDFVPEKQTHRKARLPVEQIDGVKTSLHGGDLMPGVAQPMNQFDPVRIPAPANSLLRSKRRLVNLPARWKPCDAAQMQLLDAHRVAHAKESADVVEASNIDQRHVN